MAAGANALYVKRSQEAMVVPHSGVLTTVATGTFIGMDSAGNAVRALASSGTDQMMALGFAFIGAKVGTWTLKDIRRFDAVDNPLGFGEVNSGSYTPGLPLYLSGNGLTNFSQTPPTNNGDLVQMLGIMETSTLFRIHIGEPYTLVSGSSYENRSVVPWRGAILDH